MIRCRNFGALGLFAAVLLTAGCGDDPPSGGFHASAQSVGHPAPAPAAAALAPAAPGADDPLAVPDQIAGSGDGLVPAGDGQNLGEPGDLDDTTTKMPTEHSHWLRGAIMNARVVVLLNGLLLGQYLAPVDQDITMRLRPGVNTITFAYTPQTQTSMVHLDILEGEHHPPIAPLASFLCSPMDSFQSQKPVTKTFTFFAR